MLRLEAVLVSPPLLLACPCVTNPDTVMSNAGGEVAGELTMFIMMRLWKALTGYWVAIV